MNKRYTHVLVSLFCMTVFVEKKKNIIRSVDDPRFLFRCVFDLFRTDQENQFYEYTLKINDITFEDETDIKITAKSSLTEKVKVIKPHIIGAPVGQFAFVPNQVPRVIPWRQEDYKNRPNIYAEGMKERESYRVVCSIRHRADISQPLNVFIQHIECSVDSCLSDVIDKTCRSPTSQRLSIGRANLINSYQTQFVSTDPQTLDDPSIGKQYVCCYEQNGLTILAKALTVLASTNRYIGF